VHLDRHIATVHDKILKFGCPVEECDHMCTLKQNLDRHISTVHEGTKDFLCEVCHLPFTQKGHHDSHVSEVHEQYRPYVCTFPLCDMSFARSERLVSHVQATHSPEAVRRQKVSENALAKFLTENGVLYERELFVDFRCVEMQDDKWARVDFALHINNGVRIIVENDERQHTWIETVCDVKRMGEAYESWALGGNTLPTVFIRINPHAYRRNGRLQPQLTMKARHERLLGILNDPGHAIYDTAQPLKIMHMYYDTQDGVPTVLREYGPLRECVIPCVMDA
jgi:hypothetical protein